MDDGLLNAVTLAAAVIGERSVPCSEKELQGLTDKIIEVLKTTPVWQKHLGVKFEEHEARSAFLKILRILNHDLLIKNQHLN